jgi:heme-degrading monooxygenase HmoA
LHAGAVQPLDEGEGHMYVRITQGRLKPGSWEQYEKAYEDAVEGAADVAGLRGRVLARDSADADRGFSISLWNSLEALEAYEQGPMKDQLQPALQPFFAGDYAVHRCEVRHERGLG